MRRLSITIVGLLLLGSSQVYSAEIQDEEHKMQLVERLFEVSFGDEIEKRRIQRIADNLEREKKNIRATFQTDNNEHLFKEYLKDYEVLISRHQEQLLSQIALKQQYADYYTADELQELIAFYESDIGQKRAKFNAKRFSFDEALALRKQHREELNALKDEFLFAIRETGELWENYLVAQTPMQDIEYSEKKHQYGVAHKAVFQFDIKRAQLFNGWLYLNSEEDYRDRRCLTVKIPPELIDKLRVNYGHDIEGALNGRKLMVKGEAKRHTIRSIGPNNKPVFPYYQTHVLVDDLENLIFSAKPD